MIDSSLPYPITFVVRNPQRWTELFELSSIPDPSLFTNRIKSIEDCWIVLTYMYLKGKNLNVSISDRFIQEEICVTSVSDLSIRDLTFNSFVVGCRADRFKPFLCNFNIVQNKANLDSGTDAFIPHWPQPGLIPRLKERGNRIENIVFKGRLINLYEPFRSPEFERELEKIGVKLRLNLTPEEGPVIWHDYSNDDLVLAVRDLTEKDALIKPASKLVNAWIAGVPALLGPEPAFSDLRRSELDYINVKTPQAVFEAIVHLKSKPELYQQMISNGLKRAEEFSVENIINQWYNVLSGPVAEQYNQWKKKAHIFRIAEFPLRTIKHKAALKEWIYDIEHGYRIVSGKYT